MESPTVAPPAREDKHSWPIPEQFLASCRALSADWKVDALQAPERVYSLSGPAGKHDEEGGCDFVYGCSASTYPLNSNSLQHEKYGDPIADAYGARLFANRALVCVTDGCGWGLKARLASRRANSTFLEHVSSHLHDVVDLQAAASLLLDAVKTAHTAVAHLPSELQGLTTLVGGILLRNVEGKYKFVCISIGDCKAFRLSMSGALTDVTAENRGNANDPTDPGGVIGAADGHAPDLRNLHIYHTDCEEGDLLCLVSDGVHDCFDPESVGLSPAECGLDDKGTGKWTAVANAEHEKTVQRCKLMEKEITKAVPGRPTPQQLSKLLVGSCMATTKSSRDFMESNPAKRQPKDAKAYPGKMDHTTALSLCVGAFSGPAALPPSLFAPLPDPARERWRVLVTGGSGLLGKAVIAHFTAQGASVARLVRVQPAADSPDIFWDIKGTSSEQHKCLDTAKLAAFAPHIVVHLAGENVFGIWTEWKKKEIYDSRIVGTRILVSALSLLCVPPVLFLSASGVGIYGRDNADKVLTESDKGTQNGFLAHLSLYWEAAARQLSASAPSTRVVLMRIGPVFTPNEGSLALLTKQFKYGLGGVMGSGNQWLPWISLADWVRAVQFIVEHPGLEGPVNMCAPNAVTNAEFAGCLGNVVWRPTWLWVPEVLAKTVAGEMADEMLLASIHAVPQKLTSAGFVFQDSSLEPTLRRMLA